ncbi:hypothetical protein BIV57_13540 [Mangrovactinospora gilvigrisea]|uniref:ATP/GTP-binding protein n=1 Tax=Mangrovactinospora gilvigrisea TaxID=1428644 RepID=A0A1J7BEE7_9ACTN|nr:hypothetical protein [Mangrovactinospora gilvigrisea]OIV37006.1 hypothetical protein BIV57_13540 [Mangrovactinospora gilvigrisea]
MSITLRPADEPPTLSFPAVPDPQLTAAEPAGDPAPLLFEARAEVALARADHLPLRAVPLSPDPLEGIARALASVRHEDGERAELLLDLVPVSEGRVRSRRRRLAASARRGAGTGMIGSDGPVGGGRFEGVLAEASAALRGQPAPRGRRTAKGSDLRAAVGKFVPGVGPVFSVQLLLYAASPDPDRAQMLVGQLQGALSAWADQNYLAPLGDRFPRLAGADAPWHRRSFDRRRETGAFRPRRDRWVTGPEIMGLLKPPTIHNAAPNIVRSGGEVPPAPVGLPTYTGQADLLPLGWVQESGGGWRLVGAPISDVLFGMLLGKSGFGKTELALVQALALAHAGHGELFVDPHRDAYARARPYLAHPHIQSRLWVIDLTVHDAEATATAWNPLSMEGRTEREIPDVTDYIVSAVASAMSWGDGAGRAKSILTRAVQTLAYLGHHVNGEGRPDLMPTLFQLRTLLHDEEWREQVLPLLPRTLQEFWTKSFPRYATEAVPVVTNFLERLDSSIALRAFLGSSRSAFDVRRAMDEGRVVFVCPEGGGDRDRIVTCLLTYEVLRAGLSRRNLAPEQRQEFWTFMDELTALDGASKGFLAAITEQLRKYKVKMVAATQMLQRLSGPTRQALLQNSSLLISTAADIDEASAVVKRMGKEVTADTLTRIERYSYLVTLDLNGRRSAPFKIHGGSLEQLFAAQHNPDGLPALDAAVDRKLRRQKIGDTLEQLETLDQRITDFLTGKEDTTPPAEGDATTGESAPMRASGRSVSLDKPDDDGPGASVVA